MSFTVTAYRFSKKRKSTARPSGGTNFIGVLKEGCDVLAPTISFDQPVINYNYYYIAEFDRYYYVTGITNEKNLWVVTMVVDVLASWKSSIGIQELYVLRSSQLFKTDVLDTIYPATSETLFDQVTKSSPWETSSLANGTYIVGIAGQSTTYYAFTNTALDLFFRYLLSDIYVDDVLGLLSITNAELKLTVNPLQYITSIMWFPFTYGGTSPVTSIEVGFIDVPVSAGLVGGSGVVNVITDFLIPTHPEQARGEYLNNAPYSSYSLYYPPFGILDLDSNFIANNNEVLTTINIDMRTGGGTLTVQGDLTLNPELRIDSKIGVNYQVSQVMNSGDTGLSSTLGALTSVIPDAIMGNAVGVGTKAVGGLTSAIGDYARGRIPKANTIGSMGGVNSLRGTPALLCEFKDIVTEDIDNKGRPLCSTRVINTLTGYIQVADANVSIPATDNELQEIRQLMEGGFFYE